MTAGVLFLHWQQHIDTSEAIWLAGGFGVMILLAASALPLEGAPARAQVFVNVSVRVSPPPLPVYVQPALPGPDYIWLPGYWAWDDLADDYFWVPGTWVLAPRPGYVWTPPWWGWSNGAYVFHTGYWGPHIGWYGGIVYGFGYTGLGYEGGFWRGPHYVYNRAVTNITNVRITNVYNKTVIVNRTTVNNVSFNGGPGGVQAQPTPALLAAAREPHLAPSSEQQRHFETARGNRQMFAAANHGVPPVAATIAPARLTGAGVIRAEAAGGPIIARPAVGTAKPASSLSPAIGGNAVVGRARPDGAGRGSANVGPKPFTAPPPGRPLALRAEVNGRVNADSVPLPTDRPPALRHDRPDPMPARYGEALRDASRPVVTMGQMDHHPPVDHAPSRPPAPPRPQPRPEQHAEARRPPHPQQHQHDHRD